ncbi:MAG: 4Fe-4S binding protein [Erysipelotrichaceae bacterium]|nr:4Fe-4S binding protein [Erysipelotrichaceae bacterium]
MARGVLIIDRNRCKGCELCISVCPVKILSLDYENANIKGYQPMKILSPEKCIGCCNCAVICPDQVIEIMKGDTNHG